MIRCLRRIPTTLHEDTHIILLDLPFTVVDFENKWYHIQRVQQPNQLLFLAGQVVVFKDGEAAQLDHSEDVRRFIEGSPRGCFGRCCVSENDGETSRLEAMQGEV